MWEYCGVVKDNSSLLEGLKKIRKTKKDLKDVNVNIDNQNCNDLTQVFNLQSSLISAEATILSAIERKESRGAHQRSDYPSHSSYENFNYIITMNSETSNLQIFLMVSPVEQPRSYIKVLSLINHSDRAVTYCWISL